MSLHLTFLSSDTEAFLLVRGIDEGLQDVVHFLSRLSALLNHFEEDVLDLCVSSVPFPNKEMQLYYSRTVYTLSHMRYRVQSGGTGKRTLHLKNVFMYGCVFHL